MPRLQTVVEKNSMKNSEIIESLIDIRKVLNRPVSFPEHNAYYDLVTHCEDAKDIINALILILQENDSNQLTSKQLEKNLVDRHAKKLKSMDNG